MFFLKLVEVFNSTGLLTVILTAFLAFLILRWLLSGPRNLPPGPTWFSLLGYLPFLITDPIKTLNDLSKKYGDVMSISVFGANVIYLGSYEAIHEALFTRGNEFNDRPQMAVFDLLMPTRRQGIVFADGNTWKVHRRLAVQTLRDFAFGKLSLEARVQESAQDVINVLEESKGRPMDVQDLLLGSTANIICSLLFDRHYNLDDPVFVKFVGNLKIFTNIPATALLTCSFMLKILPLPVRYISYFTSVAKPNEVFLETMSNFTKEHQETFDPNTLRDYVDVFLNEMRNRQKSGDDDKNLFTLDYMNGAAIDLFLAGTETTSSTLYWALRLLMYCPEMQKKIHEEIDEVIGRERPPGNKDRMKMPYTEAVILEVLRFSSLIPLGIFHSNPEELQFRNYTIPKKSFIIKNLWAIHYDPKYWPEPEKFDPTRYLNQDGKLIKKDGQIAFSLGKRACLGEALARTELFIILTSILQQFRIIPPDGATEPPLKVSFGTFVRHIEPYQLCAFKR